MPRTVTMYRVICANGHETDLTANQLRNQWADYCSAEARKYTAFERAARRTEYAIGNVILDVLADSRFVRRIDRKP